MSQMSAATVMEVIARLPDCNGHAADAVSAHTQVKMVDAPRLLRIPKSECPDMWIRLPQQEWPKSWSIIEDPVVLLERNVYGHLLDYCVKDNLRKFYCNFDRFGNVYLLTEYEDYSYWVTCMTSTWLESSRLWLPGGRK